MAVGVGKVNVANVGPQEVVIQVPKGQARNVKVEEVDVNHDVVVHVSKDRPVTDTPVVNVHFVKARSDQGVVDSRVTVVEDA